MQRKLYNLSVIGCGRWGAFIAKYLSDLGHAVTLYGRAGSRKTEELFSTRRNGLKTARRWFKSFCDCHLR